MREKRGVKQQAVADAIGVSRQTYSGYEKNPGLMRLSDAKKACEFLHCSLDDVFFDWEGS